MADRKLKGAAVGVAVAGGVLSIAKLASSRADQDHFRLNEDEPVSAGLTRIAVGRLDRAIEQLGDDKDGEQAVHEARKSFKRVRAVVRLARDELGDEIYRRDNRQLRDLGRRLAGARDAQVLVDTLDSITAESPQPPPDRLRHALAAEHAVATRRLADGATVDDVLGELRALRERVSAWPLAGDELESLAPGFGRIYRRGRRAYRRARKCPSTENLHELRKRTKDLWYAAQIVAPLSSAQTNELRRGAHKLADLIGEDHDLALLAERVDGQESVAELIERRRKRLLDKALPLGGRIYRRKPRRVAKLLKRPVGS